MNRIAQISPFFAARKSPAPSAPPRTSTKRPVQFARLPEAPVTASPVPHLTSLYHDRVVGPYGDRRYPGNCGGNLIRDLLRYFQPQRVLDPMTGSGTCRDVCRELAIECLSSDLKRGHDACDGSSLRNEWFDFIWVHPPYWRQKIYSLDPRDLSQAGTLDEFLTRYGTFLQNCVEQLTPGGKLAVLMGDYCDREIGFVPLTFYTKRLAFAAGLLQHCTDIIRFSHGASSSRKVYRSSFIPGLHDVCTIFEKPKEA